MKCPDCKAGRRPNGFFTVPCETCDSKGTLTVDEVWALRVANEDHKNWEQLHAWNHKKVWSNENDGTS